MHTHELHVTLLLEKCRKDPVYIKKILSQRVLRPDLSGVGPRAFTLIVIKVIALQMFFFIIIILASEINSQVLIVNRNAAILFFRSFLWLRNTRIQFWRLVIERKHDSKT